MDGVNDKLMDLVINKKWTSIQLENVLASFYNEVTKKSVKTIQRPY